MSETSETFLGVVVFGLMAILVCGRGCIEWNRNEISRECLHRGEVLVDYSAISGDYVCMKPNERLVRMEDGQ